MELRAAAFHLVYQSDRQALEEPAPAVLESTGTLRPDSSQSACDRRMGFYSVHTDPLNSADHFDLAQRILNSSTCQPSLSKEAAAPQKQFVSRWYQLDQLSLRQIAVALDSLALKGSLERFEPWSDSNRGEADFSDWRPSDYERRPLAARS